MPAVNYDLEDSWRYNLDTYAARVSRGYWQPFRWHVYLAAILTEHVSRGNARIIIEAPPRHGKSELTSRWLPTWLIDSDPSQRVILASYAEKLARFWSEKTRDAFDGSNPNTWARLNPDHSKASDWQTQEGGGMQAIGVAGGATGFGGNAVLIDDPHKDWAEVQSAVARQKVVDWFNGTIYHRLEPNASIVVIQTRWNEKDLAGYLQTEHEDDWLRIRLPALAEENDPLGREPGEALCPERYTEEQLAKIRRAVGPMVFAGVFQQRPAPAEGNIIKREWINYYGGPTGVELPGLTRLIQSWDLNQGKEAKNKKAASWVVGQCWGEHGANAYLLDQARGKWEHTGNKKQIRKLASRWPKVSSILIEDAASAGPVVSDLKSSIRRIVPVSVKGSKEARLQAVSGLFEAGNVWLPHPAIASWVPDLVEELVTFPNAEADDQVDALSQALSRYKTVTIAPIRLNLQVGAQRRPTEI
jgi:predicted phage terminase large subunit-like protein